MDALGGLQDPGVELVKGGKVCDPVNADDLLEAVEHAH